MLPVEAPMAFGSVEWWLGFVVALHRASQACELVDANHLETPSVRKCSTVVSP